VFNQRFKGAFLFRYSDANLGGVYTLDFEECVKRKSAADLPEFYFFLYRDGVVWDFTYETQELMKDQQQVWKRRLSQGSQRLLSSKNPVLSVELDKTAAYSAIGIVTSAANGVEIPQDTLMAKGYLETDDGTLKTFTILAGVDTAEWAIRFPYVESAVKHRAPDAYRARAAERPDGTITVGQNYQKIIQFQAPLNLHKLSLEFMAHPEFPDLALNVDRVLLYKEQPHNN
jgi:hypothetical protein